MRKTKKFNKGSFVRGKARTVLGEPKPGRVIKTKKEKPEKHKGKEDYGDDL